MTDFAKLVLAADTRQMKDAVKALGDVAKAGERAEDATDKVTESTKRARDEFGRFVKQSDGASSAVDKLSDRIGGIPPQAIAAAKALGAMVGAAVSLRALGAMSAQYTELTNSLKAIGVESGEVAGKLRELAGVASRTRAPLAGTVQLYQRISVAAGELGASQADVLRFTENVGLALAQQGGSAAAASGALLQLSQAIAGGTVRAEEFNSILEGAYPIALAAAQGIDAAGGSVARLRQLVIDGKISSEKFFQALLGQTEALQAAFANTDPTIGAAMQKLRDSTMVAVGSLDQLLGVSTAVARSIEWLAENVGAARGYFIAAALGLTAYYTPAIIAATIQTGVFIASLVTLRGALMLTGIGAFVVLAGTMINQFLKLVEATGGWGNALALLGEVAVGVWEGIVDGARSIPPGLASIWESVKAGFYSMVSDLLWSWAGFIQSMARGAEGIGLEALAEKFDGAAASVMGASNEWLKSSDEVSRAAKKLAAEAAGLASGGLEKARAALNKLTAATEGAKKAVEETGNGAVKAAEALAGNGSGAGKSLKGGADEAAEAVSKLQEELGQLNAKTAEGIAGWMVDGFKEGINGMKDLFKQALRDMMMMAAKNRIVVQMGAAGGFSPAQIAAASAGPGGMGGGGLLGGIGGLFGSFGAGGSAALTGLFSGGIGGAIAGVKGAMSAATGFLAKTATVLGAVALPLMLLSGLIGSKKTIGAGVQGTISGADTQAQNFTVTQRKFLFGLIKSTSTSATDADPRLVGTLRNAAMEVDRSIITMADTLGVGADAFRDFAHQFKIDTMNMTEDQAMQALMAEVAKYGEGLAALVLGGEDLLRSGENALDALTRLSTSLTAVNGIMDTLGHSFRAVGLTGADMASRLADAFGGLDAMTQASARYFDLFYSEAEQLATITRQATEALAQIGFAMPQTRAEYRAMVEALDLTTEKGREAYAALVGMADAMDTILPSVSNLTAAIAGLIGSATAEIDTMIAEATAAARANATAARDWYRASENIRQMLDRMRGTAGVLVSAAQAAGFTRARYQTTLAGAVAGDLSAAQALPGAAQAMIDATRNTARSALELARVEARVLSDLGLAAGVGDIEGARHDVIAGLLGEQVTILQAVRDYLQSGGTLNAEQIDALNGQLGALESAIAAAEMINYAFLKERLEVSVDLLADATIPQYLKRLIRQAQNGITSTIDFVTRSDLDPDMKWLALTGQSELIKTIDLVTGNTLPPDVAWLALKTASKLQKTVNLIAGADLDKQTRRIALAGNSELFRTVNAVLAAGIDPEAKRLALGNVGAYAVAVTAALTIPNTDKDVRRIVLTQQGTYAAMIRGAVDQENLTKTARRILLERQGSYIANITGVLVSDMDAPTKRLLLKANTEAARAITVAALFAGTMTEDERAALSASALAVDRIIKAKVRMGGISEDGAAFLGEVLRGDSTFEKGLIGQIVLGTLTADQRRVLRAEAGTLARVIDGKVTVGALSDDERRTLAFESGKMWRTINGYVELGNLTDAQRGLLRAIAGHTDGKITLGGSFLFDPSAGFQTWFEGATQDRIRWPMNKLRQTLGDLADTLRAETDRQTEAMEALRAEMERQRIITQAQAAAAAAVAQAQAVASQITAFDAATQGDLIDAAGNREVPIIGPDGRVQFAPVAVQGATAASLAQWAAQYWGPNGLENQLWAADEAVRLANERLAALLAGVPGFASGGLHGGGLRIVGENGPEIEATGPARYYSNAQTRDLLSGGGSAAELRALREEVARMREEQRSLGMTQATAAKRSHEILRRWEDAGLPQERV